MGGGGERCVSGCGCGCGCVAWSDTLCGLRLASSTMGVLWMDVWMDEHRGSLELGARFYMYVACIAGGSDTDTGIRHFN